MPDWALKLMLDGTIGGVMAVALWLFVRHLAGRDSKDERREASFLSYMKSRDEALAETIRGMGGDCHAVQEKAIGALDRNTAALSRVESTLTTAAVATERAAAVIERHARESVRQAG